MRSPLRPRFPDRSGCRGRDLRTRVRSAERIQRCQMCRCRDPGLRQLAPARSKKRRPTASLGFIRKSSSRGTHTEANRQ